MSGRPDDFNETTRLISGLLDGSLPIDERRRLESQLEKDAGSRRVYLQMVDQEIELACLLAPDRGRTAAVMSALIRDESAAPREWRRRAAWLSAAAAVIALALVFWPRVGPKEEAARVAQPIVEAEPVAWSADFESGTAPAWVGQIAMEGLPPGSKFGIRAVDREIANDVVSQIQLPADWDRGLFVLTPRSTLHVTYRHRAVDGWLNVFMHTDGGREPTAQNSMFMLRPGQFPGVAGEWQTVSIPFSRFMRKEIDPATGEPAFVGGPPRDGELVFALHFSGSPGFDLVIDRIWITPDGPGRETIQALR